MKNVADFLVIGGGIAGLSVAYELSTRGNVTVLEAEDATGYHSTGRSAAVMSENYGPHLWRRLVTASRAFLENPPDGFAQTPLVTDRGALFLALSNEQDALRAQAEEFANRGAETTLISPQEAKQYCPVIKADMFSRALYEPDCKDMDTNELMAGYQRALRARGCAIVTRARVEALTKQGGDWEATTPHGTFSAPLVVNAAGGWAQHVAEIAGLPKRNVVPFRRTALTFDPPDGHDIRSWPMTFDVAETFYFKPEAGRIMVSPVDMEPSVPCDAQADELEMAIAIDRIHTFTTMTVQTIKHKWAGLRTFAPDHEPVIGPDPDDESFIWLAAQGGNGIMAAPASARLAVSLAVRSSIPEDIAKLGITKCNVSPGRACVIDPDAAETVVGNLEAVTRVT